MMELKQMHAVFVLKGEMKRCAVNIAMNRTTSHVTTSLSAILIENIVMVWRIVRINQTKKNAARTSGGTRLTQHVKDEPV